MFSSVSSSFCALDDSALSESERRRKTGLCVLHHLVKSRNSNFLLCAWSTLQPKFKLRFFFFFLNSVSGSRHFYYPNGIFPNRYVDCGKFFFESKNIFLATVSVCSKYRGLSWASFLFLQTLLETIRPHRGADRKLVGGASQSTELEFQRPGSWPHFWPFSSWDMSRWWPHVWKTIC